MSLKGLTKRQKTLQLVQEYVKHKSLIITGWKNETKYQKVMRNAALSMLCRKINIPGFGPKEAYNRLRNIKSTYAQEVKKMRLATARGSKYRSNLQWFETWDTALKMYQEEENDNKSEEASPSKDETLNEDSADKSIKLEFFDEEDCANRSEIIHHQEHIENDMPRQTKVQNNENYATASMIDANNIYGNDEMSNVQIAHARHEFDVFGESIGAQLKNMPLKDALEAQMFIQNYISSLRLQSLFPSSRIK